jgi:hypothetical protein
MQRLKSKQRVADHGEVFTPAWMVEAMLDLVKDETERIDSRFLEPACGSGNFLVRILQRKLAAVEFKYGKSRFREAALRAARADVHLRHRASGGQHRRVPREHAGNLADYLNLGESDDLYRARGLCAVAEPRAWRCLDDAHP